MPPTFTSLRCMPCTSIIRPVLPALPGTTGTDEPFTAADCSVRSIPSGSVKRTEYAPLRSRLNA